MSSELNYLKKQIKENTTLLIENNQLDEANTLIEEYFKIVNDDVEAYSMKAVIQIKQEKIDEAILTIENGLKFDNNYFDLNFNLAYCFESINVMEQALFYYEKSRILADNDTIKDQIKEKIDYMIENFGQKIKLGIENTEIRKILFIQSVPCIRTNKIAKALHRRGVQVDIVYLAAHPADVYKDIVLPYKNIYQLVDMKQTIEFINNSDYDILYSSNEPDYLTVLFSTTNKPIIHDTHDMMSLRSDIANEQLVLEYMANVKSSGNIYVNPAIRDIAVDKFNLKNKPILALHSYIERDQLPTVFMEKLSSKDGEIHCVFEGGLHGTVGHHRYLEPFFLKLAENHIHVHLHCPVDPNYLKELLAKSKYIHSEGVVSPKELITQMTKYDIGLAIFNLTERNKTFLDTAFPNKIWDYLAAGLPIIFSDLTTFREFSNVNKVGKVVDFNKNIKKQVNEILQTSISREFLVSNRYTMDDKVEELIEFFSEVKKKSKININDITCKNKQVDKDYSKTIQAIKETYHAFKSNKINNIDDKTKLKLEDIEDLVSIYFYGRSGSLFLLSLLDSHPNILMLPGDYLRFYYWLWNLMEQNYGKNIKKDMIINAYAEVFPFIFDSKNVSEVMAQTGYGGDFGVRLGFTTMGDNQDKCLSIDKNKFLSEFDRVIRNKEHITRSDFFKALHIAYFYALGRTYSSNRKPIIVYYPHTYDLDGPTELYADFPNTKRICILREPVQTYGSLIDSYRNVLEHINIEQMKYLLIQILYGGMISFNHELSVAIKLEDLHTEPRQTLERLCDFLDIPWSETLMESTFNGLKWWNAKTSEKLTGFNTKVINRKHEDLFTEFDRKRLKALLSKKYSAWEYSDDYAYDELLEKELYKPFQFEKFIHFSTDEEKEIGHTVIRDLFKQYLYETSSNNRKMEVKLLK